MNTPPQVEKFDKYPQKLQVQDQNIKSRNKSYAQLQSKLRDYNNARNGRKSEAKIQMTKDQLEAEMKRMHSSEETLNASVRSFEKERVEDMKRLLKRYIQGQIYFFSRSLEGLTTAYQAVSAIDSDGEFLLIEAADSLPPWVSPSNAENRVRTLFALFPPCPARRY